MSDNVSTLSSPLQDMNDLGMLEFWEAASDIASTVSMEGISENPKDHVSFCIKKLPENIY